jgi:hypothetical protein
MTVAMRESELTVRRELCKLRDEYRAQLGSEWFNEYYNIVSQLRQNSEQELAAAKNTSSSNIHRLRRLVAGYAQDLTLWHQGEAAYRAAQEDGVIIFEDHKYVVSALTMLLFLM